MVVPTMLSSFGTNHFFQIRPLALNFMPGPTDFKMHPGGFQIAIGCDDLSIDRGIPGKTLHLTRTTFGIHCFVLSGLEGSRIEQ